MSLQDRLALLSLLTFLVAAGVVAVNFTHDLPVWAARTSGYLSVLALGLLVTATVVA